MFVQHQELLSSKKLVQIGLPYVGEVQTSSLKPAVSTSLLMVLMK